MYHMANFIHITQPVHFSGVLKKVSKGAMFNNWQMHNWIAFTPSVLIHYNKSQQIVLNICRDKIMSMMQQFIKWCVKMQVHRLG